MRHGARSSAQFAQEGTFDGRVATLLKVALLIVSGGLDTFTVAVTLEIAGIGRRDRLRVVVSFALFEGGMQLVGFAVELIWTAALGSAILRVR